MRLARLHRVTEPAAAPGPRRLDTLTSLRFFAALAVFLFHAHGWGIGWAPLKGFVWGYAGVPFFFVLSGFVLTWSFGPHTQARAFWRRRVARIYPAYFVVTVAAIALAPLVGERVGVSEVAADLLLVQSWWPLHNFPFAINSVAWSLSDEAFFYLVFPIVAVYVASRSRSARWTLGCAAIAATAFVTVAAAAVEHGTWALVLPPVRFGEFLFGIVIATALRGGQRPRIPWWSVAVAVIAAAAIGNRIRNPLADVVLVLPFAGLIAAAAVSDLQGVATFLRSRPLVWLGEVSFCFYLVHEYTIRIMVRHLHWAHRWGDAAGVLPTVACFVAALAAAAALHHGVERPGQALLARRRPGAEATAGPVTEAVGSDVVADVSVLIVARNEAAHLRECLEHLAGFDVVVADLHSTDDTVAVARGMGAAVHQVDPQPIVERVLPQALRLMDTGWVLRLDPDERLPASLAAAIREAVATAPDSVGIIEIPYQYYFRDRALRGTVWGGVSHHKRVFRPAAVSMSEEIHVKDDLLPGFTMLRLDGDPVRHMWAASFRELLAKHRRYQKAEGLDRWNRGERWTLPGFVHAVGGATYATFLKKPAIRDGWLGLVLSVIFLDYIAGSWLELRRVGRAQREMQSPYAAYYRG